ncbi:MAG: hypothetical protein OHK93_004733 [Ramalina farinacea]|uniref:Xaa-Pro dipeptidyl-peptidase-like domain-containing protein n=1 Tax=Ramalina farinacea TaxID=258253 RepID=A0AA43QWM3_9LECA|nr:hypothetical protein [Ramalina farinacea]
MKLTSTSAAHLLAAVVYLYLQPASGANNSSKAPTLPLSSDSTFNFDLLIPLGLALTGGSDISPVLGVANKVEPGNMTSYYEEFYKLANYTKQQAEDPENAYDAINVRDTWFSTANYFRRADFFIHQNWSNPDIMTLWAEQTSAFNKAIAALPIPGKRIRIPARKQNFTIEAIWYGAASTNTTAKLPTLVVGNGFDAAQEDSYHNFCAPAVLRGWNCITYEGPGQNTVRRYQDVGFIPQWEDVGTPVIDWLYENQASVVDRDSLAILGNSFGSLLALRVAAFEPRIKAVVAIDGIWDFYQSAIASVPTDLVLLFEAGKKQEFDSQLLERRATDQLSTMAAWGLDQGLWSFNTHSPFDFITQAKEYEVSDFVKKIKVPVFIGNGEFDSFVTGQPATLKQALGTLGTLHDFNGTAGYHCQTGATQEMVRSFFAWLNKIFPKSM